MPTSTPEPLKDLANEEREKREDLVSREWKEKMEATNLFDHFTQKEGEQEIIVTEKLLRAYLDPLANLTLFEERLKEQMDNLKDDDPSIRAIAITQVTALKDYLNERNSVVAQSREDLEEFSPDYPESAPALTNIYEKGKELMGGAVDGFFDSSTTNLERGAMLVGVYLSYLMIRKGIEAAFGGERKGFFKGILGSAVGLGGIYLAAEAVNKTIEKSRGYPLWTLGEAPGIHTSEEDWRSDLLEKEVAQAIRQLRSSNFPSELFAGYENDPKRKYVFAIGNIGTLTVGEWKELYENNFAAKTLSNADPYPNSPFEEDYLNETERFFLLEDIGKTLKIIGDKKMADKLIEQKKHMSIIHLALDEVIPKNPPQSP